jgi:Protein of unknown function (DUF4231)
VAVNAVEASGKTGKPAGDHWVHAQFGPIIERLALEPLQQDFLRSRWLDQVRWMEGRAGACQRWYYRLRLITIAGGVVIPALVGLDIAGTVAVWVKWLVLGLGLLVALATSVEAFFRFGDRWRHYRRTVELLKSEGWQFFQLSGPYAQAANHVAAYPTFAARVETMLGQDVDAFLTTVTQEAGKDQQPEP